MAIIPMKQAEKGCPFCGEKATNHYARIREDKKTGRRRPSGDYYACASSCRALSLSPDTGKFNLAER